MERLSGGSGVITRALLRQRQDSQQGERKTEGEP